MSKRDDIDRLARMLEGEQGAHAEAVAEERQMASLATLLRDAAPEVPPMRPEFRSELRAQVIKAAREQKVEAPLLTRFRERVRSLKYSTGVAGATGIASVAMAGGGVAAAAEYAQPDDLLYGTKLAIEEARLALTFDEVARGERALSYAQDRLDEAVQAAAEGDQQAAATALEGAAQRTEQGEEVILATGLVEPTLALADALQLTTDRVTELLPSLSGPASDAAQMLLDTVEAARDSLGSSILGPPADPTEEPTPAAPAPPPDTTTTPPPVSETTPPVLDDPPDVPDDPVQSEPPDGLLPDTPADDLLEDVEEGADELLDGVEEGADELLDGVEEGTGEILDGVEQGEPVEGTLDGTGEILDGVEDGAGELLDGVGDTLDSLGGSQD